mmetsp:Transcript_46941/g.124749  ORF Transcript_46941/g.124749 Transcript_46941/m.124749 type:complete len:218 (+) Transcript_46941:413-1066(+)
MVVLYGTLFDRHLVPHVPEQFSEVLVVRALFEPKISAMREVDIEGIRESRAQLRHGGLFLCLFDLAVLLKLALGFKTRPGKRASQKIEKHVADGLQIITATLLNTTMGIDRGVPRRAREVQTLLYLHVRLVEVALAQSKVDHVQMMRLVLDTPHEVLGFDVSVDNALGVQVLHSAQELLSDEDSGLDGETSLALMSAILQTPAQGLHHHAVVLALSA